MTTARIRTALCLLIDEEDCIQRWPSTRLLDQPDDAATEVLIHQWLMTNRGRPIIQSLLASAAACHAEPARSARRFAPDPACANLHLSTHAQRPRTNG